MQRQARAPETQPFGAEAFRAADTTVLRWLGMAGFLINSRGTTLIVDPLLGSFDMPVMIEFPISADDVPRLEAVLITHSDNDHYSVPTCRDLASVTREYHSTQYVASLMKQQGLPAYGHDIGDHFGIGPVEWRSRLPTTPGKTSPRRKRPHLPTRGLLRLLIDTPDGTIWAPGDSRLIPDHHLCTPTADALLFDFSDSEWHLGLDGVIAMANAYPHTHCCCTTGAASMLPTSRRSTPIRTHCRTASKIPNPARCWRPASHSCWRRLQS